MQTVVVQTWIGAPVERYLERLLAARAAVIKQEAER